jgi:hypothetical protein
LPDNPTVPDNPNIGGLPTVFVEKIAGACAVALPLRKPKARRNEIATRRIKFMDISSGS